MYRTLLSILAVWHGANGTFMLIAPQAWYRTVPGVTETGPYNPHFVPDIGFAFLAAAAGLAIAARHVRRVVPALTAPAVFLGGHALFHLVEWLHRGAAAADVVRDSALIVVPGFAPAFLIWIAVRNREAQA